MVCISDEPRVQCIVRDLHKINGKFEVTLPASTAVQELINQVANGLNYEASSFELVLQRTTGDQVFNHQTNGSLQDAGFDTEYGSRNSLLLQGLGGSRSTLVEKSSDVAGPSNANPQIVYPLPPPPPQNLLTPNPFTSPAGDYCTTFTRSNETGYVGLINQAMTCYLNSLLQALYMTPEFRNALYRYKFNPDHNNSIPFQLQKLFLNLQTSNQPAVETTELTESFGWRSGEVWQQHDIQELCRVMFDALEHEFKGTEQADLINHLYQGKMVDYVKCLECKREKSRDDTFLDIPLPVRPFGSAVAYSSITEALQGFVQPEILDGNNQYFCESCNKKCDAHKGLKFSSFPYLLTLHLKRFDFDYNTMHRIKLNDKVVFPHELNLNRFVKWATGEEDVDVCSVKCDDLSTTDSAMDDEASQTAESQTNNHDQEEDEGIDMSLNNSQFENEKNKAQDNLPFIYELYSIMIHSGSASGGHYYAYIKDFTSGEWFCFNDQTVTRITEEDITKTYGGGTARAYYSGAYSSSTNAYMLMYRQIDKERNTLAMTESELPDHIKELLTTIRENEEKKRELRPRQADLVKIKVFCSAGGSSSQTRVCTSQDCTLNDVLDIAYNNLKLKDVIPIERCRLVSYNRNSEQLEESFEGREKDTIEEILRYNNSNCDMFLETRNENEVFRSYSKGDIHLSVYVVNLETEEIETLRNLRTSPCQYFSDLEEFLVGVFGLPNNDIHVVMTKDSTLVHLQSSKVESIPLNKLGFATGTFNCYICPREQDPEVEKSFHDSKLHKFLLKIQNVTIAEVVLPDTSKDNLEKLFIPPLGEERINGNNNFQPELSPGDREGGAPLVNGVEEDGANGGGTFLSGTSDQSTSEDSSLTDSERTIIGDIANDCQLSSPSDSDQQLSSPENQPGNSGKITEIEDCLDELSDIVNNPLYFKCTPCEVDTGQGIQKMLRLVVDKSIRMEKLKMKLEPYVGVSSKYMRLFPGPEDERGDQVNTLAAWRDGERLHLRLYRSLREWESKVVVSVLKRSSSTAVCPPSYMFDWILSQGTSITSVKKTLLKELERRYEVSIPLERCRLWKKTRGRFLGKVLFDSQVWEDVNSCGPPKKLYIEELDTEEFLTPGSSKRICFARRMKPTYLADPADPFYEIVIDISEASNFLYKLSEISEIPEEHLKISKGMSSFSSDMDQSLGAIQNDIEWTQTIDPVIEDGLIVLYRDDRVELKPSSAEDPNAKKPSFLSKLLNPSQRREKALKIYLDNSPKPKNIIDID